MNRCFAVFSSVVLVTGLGAPAPAAAQSLKGVSVDVTVQQGESSIVLRDRDGDVLQDGLGVVEVIPLPGRTRFAFGEVHVDYFAGGAFDLIVYTDDEDPQSDAVGIPGVENPGDRLPIKAWTRNFGFPAAEDQVDFVITPIGLEGTEVKVPDPQDDTFWGRVDPDGDGPLETGDDPDGCPDGEGGGEKLGGVWALVTDRDAPPDGERLSQPVLSSSDSSACNDLENRVAPNGFPVYFAFDTVGREPQTYRGTVFFEVRNK